MVCFSDFQKIFNSLSISLIATPGCILCTAKIKTLHPTHMSIFSFLLLLFLEAEKYTCERLPESCHQHLSHFIPFPYKYIPTHMLEGFTPDI